MNNTSSMALAVHPTSLDVKGAGIAAVIDPDRDIEKYLDTADARGLRITHIIETHLHADHVSGNTELADRTGADIYVHESAGAEFETKPIAEGDALKLGNVVITVRHTPGHTPESVTLLITDKTRADEPWMALTGDTLFVGDIGRPDLVGIEAARALAGQMHNTLETEILPLPDSVMVYPGHGAGSLCGKSIGAVRSTTIGFERRFNPALAPRELNEFIDYAVSDLPEQPGNHTRIKQMNRRGPRPLGDVTPRPITIQESIRHFQQGAAMLDLRDKKRIQGAARARISPYGTGRPAQQPHRLRAATRHADHPAAGRPVRLPVSRLRPGSRRL